MRSLKQHSQANCEKCESQGGSSGFVLWQWSRNNVAVHEALQAQRRAGLQAGAKTSLVLNSATILVAFSWQ